MLYTGVVRSKKPASLFPFHDQRLPAHAAVEPGSRVSIAFEIDGWSLISAGPRAGWIQTALLRRDPILFVDLYWKDLATPNWRALVETPGFAGGIVKATQGLVYPKKAIAWHRKNWIALKDVACERYGVSWWRGTYHYLTIRLDPEKQAEFFVDVVGDAGGWEPVDIMPIVDLETAGNEGVGRAATVAATKAFVARVEALTGRKMILYANSLLHDLAIKDRLGCAKLWPARYTATLPRRVYEDVGWKLDDVALWQYRGDGASKHATLPRTAPPALGRGGRVDTSVFLGGTLSDVISQLVDGAPR